MGDINRTVEIIFEGTDRISAVTKNVSDRIDNLSSSIGDATQPFADLADKVLITEAALAALAVGGLAYAYKQSVQFESAVVELQKVLGEGESADVAIQKATELSETYGESANDILGSISDFKQAGYGLDEAMTLAKSSIDLVIAGGLDAAFASEKLNAVIKGFREEASAAIPISDALNAVTNQYGTNVAQLIEGLADLSPVASQAGLSINETISLLTPVIEIFGSGSEAARAFRTGLLRLIDDQPGIVAALDKLGVAQTDVNGALRPAGEILFDVAEAFKTAEESQKLFLAKELVGIDQSAKMVAAFDSLDKILGVYEVAMSSAGSITEEVSKRLASAEVQLNVFAISWENLARTIGDQYKLATTEAVQGGSALIQAIRDLVEGGAFDPIFDIINEVAKSIGKTFTDIAKNLPDAFKDVDFSNLIDSVRDVGTEVGQLFEAFFGDIDLSTPEGLADGIQTIVDSITALNRVVEGILDSFEPFVEALGSAVQKFVSSDEAVQNFTGQLLGFAKSINTVAGQFKYLTAGIDAIGGALSLLAITNLAKATGAFDKFGGAVGLASGALSKFLGYAAAFGFGWELGEWLEENIPGFSKFAQGLVDATAALVGLEKGTVTYLEETKAFEKETQKKVEEVRKLTNEINEVPPGIGIELETNFDYAGFNEIKKQIESVPTKKIVQTAAEVNEESFQRIDDFIVKEIPGSDVVEIVFDPNVDSVNKTKKTIDDIPSEKRLEIELQGEIDTEIAQVKADAESLQAAVEWKAKLDIAEVEANTEIVKSAFTSIDQTISSTGDLISDLFGSLEGTFGSTRYEIERQIAEENERRDAALELQKKLTEAQVAYMEARTEAIKQGDGLITVTGEGLEPEIEAFMWKILEKVKMRATEEASEFLLSTGIT